MKIFKKVLMSAMLFLVYANNIYATIEGTYVANENTSVSKVILLLVGVGLVSLVLFLGYKLDKNEASDERKEKLSKKERDLDDVYNTVYTSKTDISRELDKIEINDEEIDIVDDNILLEDEESLLTEEIINEELEKMAIEEAIKEAEENLNEASTSEDEEEYDEEDEEDDEEDDEDNDEDDWRSSTTVIIDEDEIKNRVTSNSTMVFETEKLRKIEEKLNKVYDYDDDEDELDLSELESSIKAANIKRYTRKKQDNKKAKKEEKKTNENVKRFTRKKVKKVEASVVEEVKKPRRGRPTKAEAEEKARIEQHKKDIVQ